MVTERRSQVVRSAHTRALLIAAAVESLIDHGWAATTAVDVCDRAGVTRGALMHHFPNLQGLLAAALESVYAELLASIPREPATLVELVDVTFTCVGNPKFKAVIEAWLATANDAGLRRELGPVVARFSKLVSPQESIPRLVARAEARDFYLTAREALLGLALGRAMSANASLPHEQAVLARLRRDAARLDAAR